jgi:hypothetical protein
LDEAGDAGAQIHGGRKRFRGGGPEIYSPQRNISREHGFSVDRSSSIHLDLLVNRDKLPEAQRLLRGSPLWQKIHRSIQ